MTTYVATLNDTAIARGDQTILNHVSFSDSISVTEA